jgi:hypothetical protein
MGNLLQERAVLSFVRIRHTITLLQWEYLANTIWASSGPWPQLMRGAAVPADLPANQKLEIMRADFASCLNEPRPTLFRIAPLERI